LLEEREFDAEGQAVGSHAYVWSPRYVDSPVLRDTYDSGGTLDTDERLYYLNDANFNVTALVGLVEVEPGVFEWQVAERYVYTPYGEAFVYDADWSNPAAPTTHGPLYCGYFFDSETALYHVRHRQYHPTLSTWRTRDPIGYSAGDQNLYWYVKNKPTGYVDPEGTAPPAASPSRRVIPFAPAIRVNSIWWNTDVVAGSIKVEFVVQFLLPEAVRDLDGWVVQEIRTETDVFTCNGTRIMDESLAPVHYWEAWSLDTIRLRSIVGKDDTFSIKYRPAVCTRGTHRVIGLVKGAANWELPSYFEINAVKEARELRATYKKPVGWDAIPGTPHEMIVKWDWCGDAPILTVETVPISTMVDAWGEMMPIYDVLQDDSVWNE